MPRWVDFSNDFAKEFAKLEHRDPVLHKAIVKKLTEIIENPERYKPLRGDLHGLWRVHFGSYVLKFKVGRESILVVDLEHHDNAYR